MDAFIETQGRQYWVKPGDIIEVDRMDTEPGSELALERVLMLRAEDGDVRVGTPTVDGATVLARVLDHGRGKKVIAFKYYRRKRNRHKRGFRSSFTRLEITGIDA